MTKITIELTLNELENLLMMIGFVERHYKHATARSLIAKLRKAREGVLTLFDGDEDS